MPSLAPARRPLRLDIQALRALAVLLVVLYHAGTPGFGGGYVGVDAFFVISGFLISGGLVRELRDTGRIRLAAFYARRARRLLPAACLTIVVTFVASATLVSPLDMGEVGRDGAAAALYVSNLRFGLLATDYLHAGSGATASPYLHFWSLAVEEQFYLLWPALLLLAAAVVRRHALRTGAAGSPRRLTVALAAVVSATGLLSLGTCLVLTRSAQNWAFFLSPARAFEFGAGAVVALLAARAARMPAALSRLALAAGVAGLAGADLLMDDATVFPGVAVLVPVTGAALVVLAGCRCSPALDRFWSLRPVQHLGRVSYSLYLWHWPLLVIPVSLVQRPLTGPERGAAVLAAWVLAALTLRYVEDPARRSALLRGTVKGLAVGLTLSATAAWLCFAFIEPAAAAHTQVLARLGATSATSVPGDLEPSLAAAARDAPDSRRDRCDPDVTGDTPGSCQYGDLSSQTTVVLVGDSHAAQWLPALQALGVRRRFKVLAMVKSGCPAARLPLYRPGTHSAYTECDRFRTIARQRILRARPALVVMSQLGDYVPTDGSGDRGRVEATVAALRAFAGTAPTVLLGDTPYPGRSVPDCLALHLHDVRACDLRRSVAVGTRPQEEAGAARAAGVAFVDPVPWLCSPTTCQVVSGRYLRYRDGSHLSTPFARSLAVRLDRALQSAEPGRLPGL